MKTSLPARRVQPGNVILVSLIISAIAGLTLASYLTLAQRQNMSIYRSQGWNSAMVVAEAGIEDGLQLINFYVGSFEPLDLYRWTNHASAADWTRSDATTYTVNRYITNGTAAGAERTSYRAWIFNTNNMPAVYAEGTVPWTYSGAPNLTRKVLVHARPDPIFVMAMAADLSIDMHGNRVQSDSFDSSDPRYSINHFYPTNNPQMTKDNGDIATNARFTDALNIGNAHIRGHVRTGPGQNTINVNNGSVGDANWVTNDTRGIETAHSSTDFNVAFATVTVPTNSWLPPTDVNYTTSDTTYAYRIGTAGDYVIPGLTGSLLVDAPSNAVVNIRITDNVQLGGNQVIRIAPTGAKVIIYMEGSQFDLNGGSYIDNQSGIAGNFFLYGTPALREITFTGNANFYGGIYAPQADFTLGGGGSQPKDASLDFVGASVTRSVTLTGHFNFHFDEALAKVGPLKGYIPIGWEEI